MKNKILISICLCIVANIPLNNYVFSAARCVNTPGNTNIVEVPNPSGVTYQVTVVPSRYICQVPNARMVEQALSSTSGLTQETTSKTTETCTITGAYKPVGMAMNQLTMVYENVLPPLKSDVRINCSFMSQNQLTYAVSTSLGVTPSYYTPLGKNANRCKQRISGTRNVEIICAYPSLNDALSDAYGFSSDGYKTNSLNMIFNVTGSKPTYTYRLKDKDIVGTKCSNYYILNSTCIASEWNRALGFADELRGKKESYGVMNQPSLSDLRQILNQSHGLK